MNNDKIINYITLFTGLVFMVLTFTISEPVSKGDIGPRIWPQLLAVFIIGLSIFNILIYKKNSKNSAQESYKEDTNNDSIAYPKNLWISITLLALYTFLINYIGFVVSTTLFVLVNMYVMGLKNKRNLIIISVIIVVALVVVFPKLLGVPLPRGVGVFSYISRIFH